MIVCNKRSATLRIKAHAEKTSCSATGPEVRARDSRKALRWRELSTELQWSGSSRDAKSSASIRGKLVIVSSKPTGWFPSVETFDFPRSSGRYRRPNSPRASFPATWKTFSPDASATYITGTRNFHVSFYHWIVLSVCANQFHLISSSHWYVWKT